jgi:hypothetical protein
MLILIYYITNKQLVPQPLAKHTNDAIQDAFLYTERLEFMDKYI